MLVLPDVKEMYRIISIDPGTNTLGVAFLEIDLDFLNVYLREAFTLNSNTNFKDLDTILNAHGERFAKLTSHSNILINIFNHYRPHSVICESPFLGKFPQAFEALVECKMMIRNSLMMYDHSIPLETIDPPNAKKAVGAPGKGGDKDIVKKALQQLNIIVPYTGFVDTLDEHSVDAVAVGYYKASQVVDWLKRSKVM